MKQIKILFVDDSAVELYAIQMAFERYIYKDLKDINLIVDFVTDGETALEVNDILSYNIIFTDLCMPIISGEDFIKEIQTLGYDKNLCVLTSCISQDNINWAKQHSASYFTKPIYHSLLTEYILECLDDSTPVGLRMNNKK